MKSRQSKQSKLTSRGPNRLRNERLKQVQIYIKTHKYPTAAQIADHLEVSVEVIYEDISYLKHRFHDPIDFDFSKNGYFYTGKSVDLPMPQATLEEIEAASMIKMLCA